MALGSHVPKFGNWDSDNVPYTAYFENARKEKASGVKMNPNDPEENPEAFMSGRGGARSDGVSHAVQVPVQVNSDESMSAEKRRIEGYKKQNDHWRSSSDHQKNGSRKSMTSESGSNNSNSDHSLLQPNHRRTRSDRKKSIGEANYNFVPMSPAPHRLRGGSNPSEDMSYSSASVPKFGEWDERDPTSGEGFTLVFNKVKEEKQISAAKFPAVPPEPSNYSKSQKKNTGSKSKVCCWFFSCGSN
ncbi:hypothetical protein F0562_014418 [Nyssa sinensis]|uniref:RIN4 pathogenic type III effector avirulence factor Avr cleavage site domain-containing protein n=1 Tax=Nyssa sinensis TaxID=561372 RepID=A0A5J4ZRV1_9ASTE|nr:hypothetical protein F0562_014418 [Nyssa sinensis]